MSVNNLWRRGNEDTHIGEVDKRVTHAAIVSLEKGLTRQLHILAVIAEVDAKVHEVVLAEA